MEHTATHNQFVFPILRSSEILQCMAELGIELTKTELTEPQRHKDRVRKVFLQLLETCCGLSEEDFSSTHVIPSNLECVKAPELHEESFSELKFFKDIRDFMETCGLYDFSLQDLHAPTAKRFRAQLSGAINMAKFREDKLRLYSDLIEPRTEMVLALEDVNAESEDLNKQLEVTQVDSSSKSKEIMEILNDCDELEMEIAHNNKLQKTKREEATVSKKKANDLKDEIETAVLALEEAQAEEQNLLAKVVSSPERRKDELDHQRSLLDHERKDCDDVKAKLELTETKIVNLVQAQQDCQTAIAVADEVQEKVNEYSQVMDQIQAARKELESLELEKTKVLVQKEECERTLHRIEEKIVHSRKQSKMKMEAAQESQEAAQAQLLEVEKDRRDGLARVEASEAEVNALRVLFEQEKELANKQTADMAAEYREMEKQLLKQETLLLSAIGV